MVFLDKELRLRDCVLPSRQRHRLRPRRSQRSAERNRLGQAHGPRGRVHRLPHAALSRTDINFVLVPELPFDLHGNGGLLHHLSERLRLRGHAVILVAEGAGQEHLTASGDEDASGNVRLGDIGLHLKAEIESHFAAQQLPINLKYMDPSYLIRSVPAAPPDALYCSRLGQNAVHAGMAGKTGIVVGRWSYHYVHLPASLVTRQRRSVDPFGDLWQSVIACTGQPSILTNP